MSQLSQPLILFVLRYDAVVTVNYRDHAITAEVAGYDFPVKPMIMGYDEDIESDLIAANISYRTIW